MCETLSGEWIALYSGKISTDLTILKDAEKELAALARTDVLTDFPNRRQLEERMDEALARHQFTGQSLPLIFIDVDKVEGTNDGLGQAAGDEVLTEFKKMLKKIVRNTDIVTKSAGDEFIIINGFKEANELDTIAKKILLSIRLPMDTGTMSLHNRHHRYRQRRREWQIRSACDRPCWWSVVRYETVGARLLS